MSLIHHYDEALAVWDVENENERIFHVDKNISVPATPIESSARSTSLSCSVVTPASLPRYAAVPVEQRFSQFWSADRSRSVSEMLPVREVYCQFELKNFHCATAVCSPILVRKEVKMRGRKAPYAVSALKVMPIVPSPATLYDHRFMTVNRPSGIARIGASGVPLTPATRCWRFLCTLCCSKCTSALRLLQSTIRH
jgi:hypothetical protein